MLRGARHRAVSYLPFGKQGLLRYCAFFRAGAVDAQVPQWLRGARLLRFNLGERACIMARVTGKALRAPNASA